LTNHVACIDVGTVDILHKSFPIEVFSVFEFFQLPLQNDNITITFGTAKKRHVIVLILYNDETATTTVAPKRGFDPVGF
jgi:hypothetical protein